jgi:hypothetical protein
METKVCTLEMNAIPAPFNLAQQCVERDHLEDQDIDGRMGSELILGRLAWVVYSGSSWFRIGIGGGLL